jgi:amino-acid N-acetyltransferase
LEPVQLIEIAKAEGKHRQSIVALLQEEKLPVADLPKALDNFLVALEEGKVIGAIGLEQIDDLGLLRSMVINRQYRNKGFASQLVRHLEEKASALGISCIYLLTETATAYFERKGYEKINRNEVPKSIQATSEFSSVCPLSAIVMKKQLP